MKINTRILAGIFLVITILPSIFALGVGCSYSSEIPLRMYPGEVKIVSLGLDNPDVEGIVNLEGTIIEGSEIVSLDKGPYKVLKNERTIAEMKVELPTNAIVGQEYLVKYKFLQVSGEETEGGASFSQGISRVFKVIVVEKPIGTETPKSNNTWLWVLGVIVVIVVVWVLLRKKKNPEEGKKKGKK